MKKTLSILLALSMMLAMTSCGSNSAPSPTTAAAATEAATTAAAPAAKTSTAAAPATAAPTTAAPTTAAAPTTESASEAETAPEAETPAGNYKLTSLASGSGSSLDIVSTIVGMGAKFYLFLKEDGSGSMNFLEAEIPLEWDDSCLLIPSKKGSDASGLLKIPYTCEEGVLKITTRAYSMDFNTLTDEEQAYYEANGSGSLGGAANMIVQGLTGGMEGGLAESLLFDLALGMMGSKTKPIPEGEPSKGTVTGVVDGMEFTVLGTDSLKYEGTEYIIFYYDAVNVGDQLKAVWTISTDAAQKREILEQKWDIGEDVVPERVNANYEVYPGRAIRCADIYPYDPDGGTVSFRISSYENDNQLLYYADPKNMTGAPAEPFAFDTDPSVPEELAALPEETKNVRIEDAEFFTAEDGSDAVRFCFRFLGDSDPYFFTALQDGIEMPIIFENFSLDEGSEEEKKAEDAGKAEGFSTYSCKLRTHSPVVFLVFEDKSDGTKIFEAAKTVEIK